MFANRHSPLRLAPRGGARSTPPAARPSVVRTAPALVAAFLFARAAHPAESGLQLHIPRPPAAGLLELQIAPTDGSALPPERARRIALFTSPDAALPPSGWQAVARPHVLTGGLIAVEHALVGGATRAFFVARETPLPPAVTVRNAAELRDAVAAARPGSRILMAPGLYPGGFFFSGLRGEPGLPVVIAALDPADPPVIQGSGNGMQLSDPAHLELRDLVFSGATGNGLNIDDGGSFDTPARHIVLQRLRITDVGPDGNRDGIKLSGVVDFRVEECRVERWGSGGSAVDMVGCHDGVIEGCTFVHSTAASASGANGVQTKGGTRNVVIRRNRFENAGARSVNVGGSTGLQFFRPPLVAGAEHAEARDIRVEGNTFLGSGAPIAFVGVDGATVRFNTFHRPERWVIRILQETTAAGFVACRNGEFTDNIVAFHSTQWASGGLNIGSNTSPGTFRFARNWWYCLDDPTRSRPTLPTPEVTGTYGRDPGFRDAANGDFRLVPDSPATAVGAEALPP